MFGFLRRSPIKGGYTPKQLGLKGFKKVKRIYFDNCGGTGEFNLGWRGETAHTHCGPTDPSKDILCFTSRFYLKNSDGTPSQILLHEYAHVLTDYSTYDFTSLTKSSTKYDPSEQHKFHQEDWKAEARKLGVTNPSMYSNPPY